jgi:uncharacterized phage protein (TIGR02220 family)
MEQGYALCLNKWTLDETIKNELRLLLIISSLCAKEGYCYASNEYLANIFHESEHNISIKLKKLERKEYLIIDYDHVGTVVKSRKIRLTKKSTAIDKNINRTDDKNVKENNISNINNTSINNKEIYKESIEEIINYLNNKIDTHYKTTTPKTKQLITARLNEGFTVEDFIKVIDNKYSTWFKDKKMCTYLRPETLFGTKFENYLNEKVKKRLSDEELIKMLEEMEQ